MCIQKKRIVTACSAVKGHWQTVVIVVVAVAATA